MYAEQYRYIKVIDKKNEEVEKKEISVKKAIGDYILFIVQDDYIADDYVEQFVTSVGKMIMMLQ